MIDSEIASAFTQRPTVTTTMFLSIRSRFNKTLNHMKKYDELLVKVYGSNPELKIHYNGQ